MGGMMGGGGGGSSGATSSPAPAPNYDQSGTQAMEANLASANNRQGMPLQTPQNPLTQIAPVNQAMQNMGHGSPGMPGGMGAAGGAPPSTAQPQTPMPAMGNANPMMTAFQSGMNPFGSGGVI